MKQTYKNPSITIVNIETAQMIAQSPGYGGSTGETSGNLSRQESGFSWDDDEE